VRESDIQRQIRDYLSLRRIFHYRNNSGGFKDTNQHFYRFGVFGSPDIICVIEGRYVGIEVKASKGRQSEHQKAFQRELEEAGGLYIIARSLSLSFWSCMLDCSSLDWVVVLYPN